MGQESVLNVGLIGVGVIANQAHIPAWRSAKGARIVALADLREKRAKELAEKWEVKDWYTDYRRVLERDDIQIVDLALPHDLHCKISCEAMEAGKHVLVEKPMARSLAEIDQMIQVAHKARVKLMVSEFWRYSPMHRKALAAIQQGYLGEVFMMRSEHCNRGPGMVEPLPLDESWKLDLEKVGAGILLGVSCHPLSMATMFFGDVDSIASMATYRAKPNWFPENYELTVMSLLNFRNGIIGEITSSVQTTGYFHYQTWIFGSKGNLVMDMVTGHFALVSEILGPAAAEYGKPLLGRGEEEPAGYAAAVQHLVDCINQDREPETGGGVERETVRTLLAGYKSMREGRIVKASEI